MEDAVKVFIICNSKTGFTRRYADWIAEETGGEIVTYQTYRKTEIDAKDIVIYGSRVHIGKVEHLDKIKVRFAQQHLIVFATGGIPAAAADAVVKLWENSFSDEERTRIPHFYLQGGLNYEKMGFGERTFMKMVAKLSNKSKNGDAADSGFADAIQSSYDITSREYVEPLVKCVKGLR